MKRMMFSAALVAAVGLGAVAAFGQANEDNVAAAQAKYPLAAKKGEDSHAFDKAPEGATNQGKFDDKTWTERTKRIFAIFNSYANLRASVADYTAIGIR